MGLKKKLFGNNEIIFVVGIFLSNILMPFLYIFNDFSTYILVAFYLLLILCALMNNGFKIKNSINGSTKALAIFVIVLFLFDFSFRYNSEILNYFISLVRCFIIPLILYSLTTEKKRIFKYWCKFGAIIGIFYLLDPLLGYQFSNGYMPFGFNIMLPAFCGAVIMWLYYKKIIFLPLSLLYLFEIAIFANKGALISAIVVIAFCYSFNKKNKIIAVKRLIILGLVFGMIWFWKNDILQLFINVADRLNFDSYSLNTLKTMIQGDSNVIFSARTDIWLLADKMIKEDLLFGKGIGYFRSVYDIYPHNVFLELLVSFGLLVFIPFSALLIQRIIKVFSSKSRDDFFFGACLLIIWLIPLFISLTLWDYTPFWLFFIITGEIACSQNKKSIESIKRRQLTYGNC